jgi:hypothetical protein
MRRGVAITIALLAAVATSPAQAQTHRHHRAHHIRPLPDPVATRVQTLTVTNGAGIGDARLSQVERAVQDQSAELARYWGTPVVRYGPGGWPVTITSDPNAPASHGASSGQPFAIVDNNDGSWLGWTYEFSHEIMEMLVDPLPDAPTHQIEVCDQTGTLMYRLDGVTVADFVTPAWATPTAPGPYDRMRQINAPGSLHA